MKLSEYNANSIGFTCAKMVQNRATVKIDTSRAVLAVLKYSVVLFVLIEVVRYSVNNI